MTADSAIEPAQSFGDPFPVSATTRGPRVRVLTALDPATRGTLEEPRSFTSAMRRVHGGDIVVELESQESVTVDPGTRLILKTTPADVVWFRKVCLRTACLTRVVAYAESLLVPHRLPDRPRRQLVNGDVPIGDLLAEAGIGKQREFVEWGVTGINSVARRRLGDGLILHRTYLISDGPLPLMRVTEHFPGELAVGEP